MSTFKKRFVKARVKTFKTSPFFATLLLNADYEITDEIPTAATDGTTLLFNEEWMCSLSEENFNGVLFHEVLHMALGHVERLKNFSDHNLAQIASDIVVNGIIKDNGMSVPETGVFNDKLKHLSVQEIYYILQKEKRENKKKFEKDYGKEGEVNQCLQKKRDSNSNSNSNSNNEKNGEKQSSHSSHESQKKEKQNKQKWKDILSKAHTISKMKNAGLEGAGLSRIFKELLQPTIDWRDVLYRYVTDSRSDFEGYDRRFIHRNLYLDDLAGSNINIAVFVDTSGSVDEELLSEFVTELTSAISCVPNTTGHLYYFDTKLYPQGKIEDLEKVPEAVGFGGTNFHIITDELNKLYLDNICTKTLGIIYTDGYAKVPETPPETDLLWCISPGGKENEYFNYGEVIRIIK